MHHKVLVKAALLAALYGCLIGLLLGPSCLHIG